MSFFGRKYARASRWFEWIILGTGVFLVLFSIITRRVAGGLFVGLMLIFVWTFPMSARYGSRLLEVERRFIKSCQEEAEMRADVGLVVRLTLLASLPIYMMYIFPFLLLPIGGIYALAFFVPLFIATGGRFIVYYRRWQTVEIKPNFYWIMQIGICVFMIVLAYVGYFLGYYGGR